MTKPWQELVSGSIDNSTAKLAEDFAHKHSADPGTISAAQLTELTRALDEAEHAAALGVTAMAELALAPLRALPTSAQDVFTRSLSRATSLRDVCINRAYMFYRCGTDLQRDDQLEDCISVDDQGTALSPPAVPRDEQAIQRGTQRLVRTCLEDFPGLSLADYKVFPISRSIVAVQEALAKEPSGTLKVVATNNASCSVQYNGMPVGTAPVTLPSVRVGIGRVQLTCAGVPSRVHITTVHEGKNTVSIDPEFDAAVMTSAAGVALYYPNVATRNERSQRDGGTIGRTLGAACVALLFVEHGTVRVVPIGKPTAARTPSIAFIGERYDESALRVAAQTLDTCWADQSLSASRQ